MKDDLQAKLRRLGVHKGARQLKSASPRPPMPVASPSPVYAPPVAPLETLLPTGRIAENATGTYFVVDHVYPLHKQHGNHVLQDAAAIRPRHLAPYLKQPLPESIDQCLFIDTETTGLAGAGTVAFMVGVGFIENGALIVRQYFMRDFHEEEPILVDLAALLERYPTLVSFNGKTFDIPLLRNRYLMNRVIDPLADRPHIDLLHPARRIWRKRLGSVALSALETNLLGVRRTGQDIPGALIPQMYHAYVQSQNARGIDRVFYHNEIDIVSMVTLLAETVEMVSAPEKCDRALDVCSVGRWQADLEIDTAEHTLRHATTLDCAMHLWQDTRLELAAYLKKQDRRADAVPYWMQVASTSEKETGAHIELAKYYEWHSRDLHSALSWTQQALDLTSPFDRDGRDALHHRRQRLERKIARQEWDATGEGMAC